MQEQQEQNKVDFRVYIGIVFFRWQVLAICFLYSLLAGVLYLNFMPKTYLTTCKMIIHRDTNLEIQPQNVSQQSPLVSLATHMYLLQSEDMSRKVARQLMDRWGREMGSLEKMTLKVKVDRDRQMGSTLNISVESRNAGYAEKFMEGLLAEHQAEWNDIQSESTRLAGKKLEDELVRLEENIKSAEDDVIEYERLNDTARTDAKRTMEQDYLRALLGRKSQLTTELMLLEAQFPMLKDANAGVISEVAEITRKTGTVEAVQPSDESEGDEGSGKKKEGEKEPKNPKPQLPDSLNASGGDATGNVMPWQDEQARLAQLQQKEKDLASKFKPEHPELVAVRKDIETTKARLDMAAQLERGRLMDRHKALTVALNALETAEYNWKNKNMQASMRRAELRKLSGIVDRYDVNYKTLYTKLHDMMVSQELKAEHFKIIEAVRTEPDPIWPDPLKILLMTLAVGLGSGFGLVVLLQAVDNRVQTIRDVEKELGIPFMGGIPYWADSGLDNTVRPIVTEDDSIGAIEAYRALRTMLLTSLAKEHEKIVLLTSADSKEGKTLTALNLAIMIAQMGRKVLLIDMDLRRGRLHKSLGVDKEPGFSGALVAGTPVRDAVIKTRFENLDFIPSGATVENTAELLQTADVRSILRQIQDDYDYVIVDTSPVLRVTDTVVLATQKVGSFLFVAHVNRTPKPMIRYAITLLKEARILGLIMNSIEMHRISSLYYAYQYPNYAYYSNAYRYGYDYYDYGDGKRRRRASTRTWDDRKRGLFQWLRRTFLPME